VCDFELFCCLLFERDLSSSVFSFLFFFFSLSLPQKKEADDFIPNDGGVVTAYRREEKQLLFRRGTQK
tara:strand:+ start:1137 stop:1340 length:204 start_codon:yes stop_codon:yes gene_type:complete